MVVQWPSLPAPDAGGPDVTPDQGTRSHVLKLGTHRLQLKDPSCRSEDGRSRVLQLRAAQPKKHKDFFKKTINSSVSVEFGGL